MELIRVVDEDGNDTDEVLEREDVHDLSKLHNEVTIYIINKKGEVLLQRRSKNRRFCPNMLGVIAGHVGYLEDPLSCAKRELEEEVGLVVDKNEVHVLCNKYLVLEDENNHFMYPYYVITDLKEDDFNIQKEEVSYVKWHNIDDVIKLINDGTATCEVLDTTSKWFGVTYPEDRQSVVDKIKTLVDSGVYPNKLF